MPRTHSQSSIVVFEIGANIPTPALLHSTWTAPKASIVAAASASTSDSCETSVGTPITSCPSARRTATASSSGSARTSAATTRMPAPANARTMPRPMPAAAPVTTATRPSTDCIAASSLVRAAAPLAVDKQTLVGETLPVGGRSVKGTAGTGQTGDDT